MSKEKIIKKINEAIASPKVDTSTKELLQDIKVKLRQAKSYDEQLNLVLKLIELMAIFSQIIK